MVKKRFRSAQAINLGACNPSGICHAILEACEELRNEGAGTAAICSDPAIRIMVNQLNFIVGNGELPYDENHKLQDQLVEAEYASREE